MEHYKIIYTSPADLNTDGEGTYTEYIVDTSDHLDELPTSGSVYAGPRPGSLALVEVDSGHDGGKTLYILTVGRQWDFIKEVQ